MFISLIEQSTGYHLSITINNSSYNLIVNYQNSITTHNITTEW